MLNKIQQQMKDEILTELRKEYLTLDEVKESSHEFVDGYLPVYYNQILDEWKDMPTDYDNRGFEELGLVGESNIYRLMTADLYVYYTDLFNKVIDELEQELEEVDA